MLLVTGVSGSIVICITPLISIMMDQRAKFKHRGLVTEFIGEAQTDSDAIAKVLKGEVQLVFISSEAILNRRYRSMLLSDAYKDKLIA